MISLGAGSVSNFGFKAFNVGVSGTAGLTLSIAGTGPTTSGGVGPVQITTGCSDPDGNIYLAIEDDTFGVSPPLQNPVLAKFSSDGTLLWSYTTDNSVNANVPNFSSCAYYNNNIYWLVGDNSSGYYPALYIVPVAGATSVTRYDLNSIFTGYPNFIFGTTRINVDASGNVYLAGFGFDTSSSYRAATWIKLNNTLTSGILRNYYITDTNYDGTDSFATPHFGTDGSAHFSFYNAVDSPVRRLYVSIDTSGNIFNNGYYLGDVSYWGSRTSDSLGNTYTMFQSSSSPYNKHIIAQDSTGTILWQKRYNVSGFGYPSSNGTIVADSSNLYLSFGDKTIFSVAKSTGNFLWGRAFSKLDLYGSVRSFMAGVNPVFCAIPYAMYTGSNQLTVVVQPSSSTGGRTGTYNYNIVTSDTLTSAVSSLTYNAVSHTQETGTYGSMSSTTATLTSYNSSMTITSASIPV